MKFATVILAVLAVASPLSALQLPASGSGALAKELQNMVDVIQFDKIIPLFMSYAANEEDVHAALQILQSNEFKLFAQDVEAIPEVKNLLNYTQEAGLDIRTLINKLTDILDLDHISPLQASADAETLPELQTLLKYVQEAGIDNITLQNRLNEYLDLEHISPPKEYEGAKCGGLSDFTDTFLHFFFLRWNERESERLEKSKVIGDFRRECGKLQLRNVYLSIRSNEHYVKLVQEAEKAGIFSAEYWQYYPMLMKAKIALALAL